MFEFTKKSKKIIELSSQNEGKRMNSEVLGPEHIMISLLKDDDSVASRILKNLGVNFEKVIVLLERSLKPSINAGNSGKLPVNQGFKNIVELSRDEAKNLKNSYVGTEHLLLAVFKDGTCGALDELKKGGINYEIVKDEILRVLGIRSVPKTVPVKNETKTSPLEEFATDLTALAVAGQLDPVIGRDVEISRVIRILSRKRKTIRFLSEKPV